jgi:hypothetical protein
MLGWIRRLVHGDPTEPTDSEVALQRTREARREVEDRWPTVRAVVAPFKQAREENHWAERVEAVFAARRGVER